MAEIQPIQPTPPLPPMRHTLLTADDLWQMPDDGNRCELVKGVLRKMAPAGMSHGLCAAKIGGRLIAHVEKHNLGYVCAAETGFTISRNPDTVRAPDAAFISRAALERQGISTGYWEGVPELVVEVISPRDTYKEMAEKVADWLTAGCALVWVANPRRKVVEVHRAGQEPVVLRGSDILDGGDVVPGFQCEVGEFFV